MKKNYPDYRKLEEGYLKSVEEVLNKEEKLILDGFCRMLGTTAGKYRIESKLKHFVIQFRDVIEKPINQWLEKDIQEVVMLINQSDKAEWTKNDLKTVLKRFVKWFYKSYDISYIKRKSEYDSFNHERVNENTLINLEEFERMLRSANTLKQKAILSLLFETGCRPQELRILKWNDLKIDDDVGSVNLFSGKTKKSRTIPIKDCMINFKRWGRRV